ncbi:related to acyl-CoA cholesterol acyltransferase [Cephalotrichum gorgonifer]|uniref:O-acyltransferase n=1 Tax=Cephalotrichum gorgonifer TaxID=2041049 RepID=A0AAE8N6F8_9PEZI|nr:related to acyl-CoA cholesterol acyltransferase [Cephalotrichum gorgonifer]
MGRPTAALDGPGNVSSPSSREVTTNPIPRHVSLNTQPEPPAPDPKVTVNGRRPALRPRGKFRDLVFTRTYSAFDRKNEAAANSPFYGFFTLCWLTLALFILKTAVANWKTQGNPLGTNDIMRNMLSRDVLVLMISDGVICALTFVSWLIQLAVLHGYLDWDRTGWILQNTIFIGGVVGLTIARDWPWTHTVFFVLHGLVLLMKQHSYAFYNGHLSTVSNERTILRAALGKLKERDPAAASSTSVSAAASTALSRRSSIVKSRQQERRASLKDEEPEIDEPEIDKVISHIDSNVAIPAGAFRLYEMVLEDEIDFHTQELVRNTTAKRRAYPNNLNFCNLAEFLFLPTVVYELEYPRTESINWYFVLEKLAATVGILFVMNMLSQTFIYPVVMRAVSMKQMGVPLCERLREFPWMLSDLMFPFMAEYLLTWYLIWETILNTIAELTRFADRNFYDPWWNSVSWDQFAREWNKPVHNFLLRHVYHSSISSMKVDKHTATLITFFLSACVHEMVMWCLFKKLRGYLLVLQMCQLPLIQLSRTKWLRDRKVLGNIIFWIGIFTGPSLLCSLYLIL